MDYMNQCDSTHNHCPLIKENHVGHEVVLEQTKQIKSSSSRLAQYFHYWSIMENSWLKILALISWNCQTFLAWIQKQWVTCCMNWTIRHMHTTRRPLQFSSVLYWKTEKNLVTLKKIVTWETNSKVFLFPFSLNSTIVCSRCNNLINQMVIKLMKAQMS